MRIRIIEAWTVVGCRGDYIQDYVITTPEKFEESVREVREDYPVSDLKWIEYETDTLLMMDRGEIERGSKQL